MEYNYLITNYLSIRNFKIVRNGINVPCNENFANFAAFAKDLYKRESISYPKFYKMDNLSKLGFVGVELLLRGTEFLDRYNNEEIGIVIMNSGSSLDTDIAYNNTIRDRSAYFPSPSLFVYTLPNILTGEICIRHSIKGENAFLVSGEFDAGILENTVRLLLDQARAKACLCGWVELLGDNFESVLYLIEKKSNNNVNQPEGEKVIFTAGNLNKIYQLNC